MGHPATERATPSRLAVGSRRRRVTDVLAAVDDDVGDVTLADLLAALGSTPQAPGLPWFFAVAAMRARDEARGAPRIAEPSEIVLSWAGEVYFRSVSDWPDADAEETDAAEFRGARGGAREFLGDDDAMERIGRLLQRFPRMQGESATLLMMLLCQPPRFPRRLWAKECREAIASTSTRLSFSNADIAQLLSTHCAARKAECARERELRLTAVPAPGLQHETWRRLP